MKLLLDRSASSAFVALSPFERFFIIGILAFFIVVPFPFVLTETSLSRSTLYLSYMLYVFTLAIPFVIPRFRPSFFHPVCFYVIWIGIQGLMRGEFLLPISGLSYHRALGYRISSDFDYLIAFSFLLDSIGLVSLYLGYLLFPRVFHKIDSPAKPKYLELKTLIWVSFAGGGLIALATIGGGLDQVLMQRGLASDERIAAQVGGHWGFLAGLGVLAPTIWLAFEPKAIKKKVFWSLLILSLLIKFASTGSRGGTIFPLIIVGSIYILQSGRVPYKFVLLGTIFAILVVGAGGQFRKSTMQADSLDSINVEVGVLGWLTAALDELHGQGAENSGQLAVLGAVPDMVPHLWGGSYLSVPYIFLPSAIFGDKPDAGGRLLSTLVYNNPLNTIPAETAGEAYWNFSVFGVVLVFFIHGVLLKFMSGLFRSNNSHPLFIILYVYFLFRMQINSDALYSFAHAIVPLVFIYMTFLIFRSKA